MDYCRKRGFTLVEMLIVIAIIGVLAGLIMPGLFKAKERGRTIQCAGNLKNMGIGLASYVNRHQSQFPKLTPTGYSQIKDSHGTNLLPVEAVCRFMSGEISPQESWLGLGRPVDKVAVCPKYPKALLDSGSSDFNPCAYSYNRHVDGDGSALSADHLAERPSGGSAYCCMRTEGNATSPSELCVIMDSADTGNQYQHWFAWINTPENVDNEGSLPNRHQSGGNLLFADGHVEWKANKWLRDRGHARQWVTPADNDSGAWSN